MVITNYKLTIIATLIMILTTALTGGKSIENTQDVIINEVRDVKSNVDNAEDISNQFNKRNEELIQEINRNK